MAVEIEGNSELNLANTTRSVALAGTVRTDDGSPLREAFIDFRNQGTGQQFPVKIQNSGEFALENPPLRPGTYDVFVGPAPLAVRSMSATGAKVVRRSLEVEGGQDIRLNAIVTRGSGRITGVALKDGKGLDGVMVVLVPEAVEPNHSLFRRDQSDSDGSFNLDGVVRGKYTVVAIENGWELEWYAPGALDKYLAGGTAVEIQPNTTVEVKVKSQ